MKTRKYSFCMIICLLLTITIWNFTENHVKATEVILPSEYYFTFNGQKRLAGSESELITSQATLFVSAGGWTNDKDTTVEWVSSEPMVVSLKSSTSGINFINLVSEGPGFSTITAILRNGTNSYTISCVIKVDLSFDYQKTGLTTATTTKERILIVDKDQTRQIYLKHVDLIPTDDVVAVSGAAISTEAVTWASDNESVATVDKKGLVTATGSGSATITVTTNTVSTQNKALDTSLTVVVKPKFSISYDDSLGGHHVLNSLEAENAIDPDPLAERVVPSNFVLVSTANLATNLKWEVYDCSFTPKRKIAVTDISKMTYTVSSISGNVSFSNIKAGTYEIYAFVDSSYNVNTKAPYAYLKIIVPIDIGDKNIVMTVGDTYSILDNSNIPGANIFTYGGGVNNIASVNSTTGVITAKMKGQVTITLVYKPSLYLYDEAIDDININITVIDGIALNITNATIFTTGSLLLSAIVTDPTQPIIWSSSDKSNSIATVTDGLVKGIKAGTVMITAEQNINGIVKRATCLITVQPSVTTIVVDPAVTVIPIRGYKTLHATITPKNLSGVTLQWKSSNNNIVTIVEANALTATIQGVAGGNAVISAINQDNVVVGYCHVSVQQPVTGIALSETNVALDLNTKRLQLRATAYPENAMNKTIIWTTTDATKAKVDANGLVTLLKQGTVTIIATSEDNPQATAMCNITIQIPVVSITLDEKEKIMYVGQAARLSYVILPVNANNNSILWTSTNGTVATVDNTGKVSAKSVGTTVIILKTLDGGYSVYCTITVKRVATGVKFDVSKLELKAGEFYYIKTTLTPKDSTDNGLVWESSDTKVAMVDDNGKVSAKDTGTAIIMARTEAGAIAYCTVTVTQPVAGLILNFSEKTIYIGDIFKLKVSVTPTEATELGVTWKSSNLKVATVSETGEITGLTGGMTVITCTTLEGGYSATCVITVIEFVSTIKLDYESYRLGIGKTVKLNATVSTETSSNKKVTWISNNEDVATVNQKGKVSGISIGYATISAISQDGSEVEASCEIRVVNPVTSITLNKSYLAMLVGESKPLKVTIRPTNSTYKKATWTSSDESIAIVDEDGVVTALKAGSTTIVADAQDSSGKKAVCYISIRDRTPATGITLMDKQLVMVPGEDKLVQVALNPITSTDGFSWSTDNVAVARVDKNTGKITARATGTANITVMTDSGKTAVIEVTVIGLNITDLTLEQYTTYEYPLVVEGATTTVRWSVDNPSIAVVTNGRVSTRAVGRATITATVNGRKLNCKLTVTKMK